ncbi:MAG TPA: PEP-CTERM sorting domain-containing protein [Polyangiaceae bacterium]|nr:PEP-CTERM sorting domain-containing protein [Polyangiaceae bacterium]
MATTRGVGLVLGAALLASDSVANPRSHWAPAAARRRREPGTLLLVGAGLAGLVATSRKRRA